MSGSILPKIKEFFGYKSLGEFATDWKLLTKEDQEQLKAGIEDGTLSY